MQKEVFGLLSDESRVEKLCADAFAEVDRKKSGKIAVTDVSGAVGKLAKDAMIQRPSEEQVEAAIAGTRREKDGQLSQGEFLALIRGLLRHMADLDAPQQSGEQSSAVEGQQESLRQSVRFQDYMEVSGLRKAFQLIFSEVIQKRVDPSDVFTYSASRLRQLGLELSPSLPPDLRPPNPS